MLKQVEDIFKIVNAINPKPCVWSYLTSIEYMLNSNPYMSTLLKDAQTVSSYVKKDSNILDFGTGSGIFASLLRDLNKKNNITAIDAQEDKSEPDPNFHDSRKQQKMLWKELSKKYNIKFSHYDGLKIPFKDNSFDVISAYAVLEHVPVKDLDFVVKELYRVLKKDGHLFVFKCPRTFAATEHIAKFLGLGHHFLLYSDDQIRNIVKKGGFKCIKEWRSDMTFKFPGKVLNPIFPLVSLIDSILIKTPLNLFAHNINLIFKK